MYPSRASAPGPDIVVAAGGVLWRQRKGQREFAVIQRRRYGGDYTLPKGKLKPDESPLAGAVREVQEETGWHAEPVEFAGPVTYTINGQPKLVLFWNMQATHESGRGVDESEVAQVLWLDPKQAMQQLTYPLERELLSRASGVPVVPAPTRLRRVLSTFKLRRPSWLRTRQSARLEAAILTATHEIHWRAVQANQVRAPWAYKGRILLQASRSFLKRGMIEEGWHTLQAARRFEIHAMDDEERAALGSSLRAEAETKLGPWRRATVKDVLRQPVPARAALKHAQYIMDEHGQNVYRRVTLAANHLSSMAVVVGLLLVAALSLSTTVPIPVGRAVIEPFELTVYVLLFGMLGGAVSAMVPRAGESNARRRVPEQLAAATFSKLRPVLGGASALILYLFINSGLFVSGLEPTQGLALLFAFAAGFSERLIVRAIARVDSVNDEGEPKQKPVVLP